MKLKLRGKESGRHRHGWEPCQRCYKQKVLLNTICPGIKGSETQTQLPIRQCGSGSPGQPVWNYCSDLEPAPARWREGH